jgi:hypothetical protein
MRSVTSEEKKVFVNIRKVLPTSITNFFNEDDIYQPRLMSWRSRIATFLLLLMRRRMIPSLPTLVATKRIYTLTT